MAMLGRAGWHDTGRTLASRNATSWVLRKNGRLAVLRRLDPRLSSPRSATVGRDVEWLHEYLDRLAETGFPAPRPVQDLDGHSWMLGDGAWWELISYLPGDVIGWDRQPALYDVGAMLSWFHTASAAMGVPEQRPLAIPVGGLDGAGLGHDWQARLDALVQDLDRIGHSRKDRLVIHGDFTTHNVLADGQPPQPCGVIDFELAHVENPWADIGFALWRSGRLHQDADGLDLDRVRTFVEGYHSIATLPRDAATAIPVYAAARGLQQAVRARRAGVPIPERLMTRVDWITSHRGILSDQLSSVLA